MTERVQQGEVPAGADSMGKEIMLGVVNQVRRMRERLDSDSDNEVGIRTSLPGVDGYPVQIDERLDDLHVGRNRRDGSMLIRLKDTAKKDIAEHPLRDGITLSVAGIGLLGAGLYARSRLKK